MTYLTFLGRTYEKVRKACQWALTEPWRGARGALAIQEHTQTHTDPYGLEFVRG